MNNIHYISFANKNYDKGCVERQSKYLNNLKDLFSYYKIYNEDDLGDDFKKILKYKNKHGFYFWSWKPYIIYNKLATLKNNDFLMYSDCGCKFPDNYDEFIKDIKRLCLQLIKENKYISLANCGVKNLCICNKYILEKMGLLNDDYFLRKYKHYVATIIILRNSEKIRSFIKSWMDFMLLNYDKCINLEYQNKNDGLDGYIHNGADQAILQCLLYKNKINILDCNYLFVYKYKHYINHGNRH